MVKRRTGKVRINDTQSTVAIGAILVRAQGCRKVIKKLPHTDHVVVTICAKCGGINVTRSVVKDAGSKGTRSMTENAILGGRQVVGRLPARVNRPQGITMAGIAAFGQNQWVGVVDNECGKETVGVMACSAVGGGYQVCGHCGRLGGCVDTIGFGMACCTG